MPFTFSQLGNSPIHSPIQLKSRRTIRTHNRGKITGTKPVKWRIGGRLAKEINGSSRLVKKPCLPFRSIRAAIFLAKLRYRPSRCGIMAHVFLAGSFIRRPVERSEWMWNYPKVPWLLTTRRGIVWLKRNPAKKPLRSPWTPPRLLSIKRCFRISTVLRREPKAFSFRGNYFVSRASGVSESRNELDWKIRGFKWNVSVICRTTLRFFFFLMKLNYILKWVLEVFKIFLNNY